MLRLTCADAVDKAPHHDHLEGPGAPAEQHEHGSGDGHAVVQQKTAFPGGPEELEHRHRKAAGQSLAPLPSPTSRIW